MHQLSQHPVTLPPSLCTVIMPSVKTTPPPPHKGAPTSGPLVCLEDYEVAARAKLPIAALDYYRAGATAETTLRENKTAMNRWYITRRLLRDVSKRDLSTTVLGHRVQLPVAMAPTAMQRMAHPDGECASAAAAGRHDTFFTLSTMATTSIEELAQHAPNTKKFFQLYIYKDRRATEELVRRAERAGYGAIVLTIDAPYCGIRRADIRNRFSLPPHLRMANFESSTEAGSLVNKSQQGSGINEYVKKMLDPSIRWEDLKWLVRLTSLPVVVKGVLCREDARLALECGVAAIWVSNHGGRQVDSTPPSIEALPHVVAEVGGRCPVFVDGGFSQGTDVFKALALGADMVFLGRPILWGLACGGEDGVHDVLTIIKDELDNIMANTGCCTIQDINRSMVARKELYAKL